MKPLIAFWQSSYIAVFVLLTLSVGCKQFKKESTTLDAASDSKSMEFCAAIRGNGTYAFTHFGSIARILEDYGEIQATAGGSSASITSFLYESMKLNPVLAAKTDGERRIYLSLMMKSLLGVIEYLGTTEEANAIRQLANIGSAVKEQGLKALANGDSNQLYEAFVALRTILQSPDVVGMVNKDLLAQFNPITQQNISNYSFLIQEAISAAETIVAFDGSDPRIFFRQGIASYEGLSRILGKTGNFYSGVDQLSGKDLSVFLQECSAGSKGKTWAEIKTITTSKTINCSELFYKAIGGFLKRLNAGQLKIVPADDRLQHRLGHLIPVIAPTALLDDKASVDQYKVSMAAYQKGEDPLFRPDFDRVKFGYFVPVDLKAKISANLKSMYPQDEKSRKAIILTENQSPQWSKVLQLSPLEPGLAPFQLEGEDRAYIGGWPDLHPVQVLKSAGCEKVIYITRRGEETGFVTQTRSLSQIKNWNERNGVAELLNMTAEQQKDLYLPLNPNNSYYNAIKEADAVWCTDWNHWNIEEVTQMFTHSYGNMSPSVRGPHVGYTTGISINQETHRKFFSVGSVPELKQTTVGCKI